MNSSYAGPGVKPIAGSFTSKQAGLQPSESSILREKENRERLLNQSSGSLGSGAKVAFTPQWGVGSSFAPSVSSSTRKYDAGRLASPGSSLLNGPGVRQDFTVGKENVNQHAYSSVKLNLSLDEQPSVQEPLSQF